MCIAQVCQGCVYRNMFPSSRTALPVSHSGKPLEHGHAVIQTYLHLPQRWLINHGLQMPCNTANGGRNRCLLRAAEGEWWVPGSPFQLPGIGLLPNGAGGDTCACPQLPYLGNLSWVSAICVSFSESPPTELPLVENTERR